MNVGRPIEFDPDQALLAAMDVFWRQGYEATSLQDLLQVMGLSKSSFYQAFGSKHELFQRCLALFRERQVRRMRTALHRAPSGHEFLRGVLRATAAEARTAETPKGCLIMNTATEFAGRDPAVSELVADGARDFAGVFREAVVRAQAEGDISPTRDPDTLAHYVVTTVSGLKTMVKAGLSPATVTEVAEVALGALR